MPTRPSLLPSREKGFVARDSHLISGGWLGSPTPRSLMRSVLSKATKIQTCSCKPIKGGKRFVARDSHLISGGWLGRNHPDSRLCGNDGVKSSNGFIARYSCLISGRCLVETLRIPAFRENDGGRKTSSVSVRAARGRVRRRERSLDSAVKVRRARVRRAGLREVAHPAPAGLGGRTSSIPKPYDRCRPTPRRSSLANLAASSPTTSVPRISAAGPSDACPRARRTARVRRND